MPKSITSHEAPLDPTLPGRWGKMTRSQMDAEVAQIEAENPEGVPIPKEEWDAMKRTNKSAWKRRKQGRPKKPLSQHVARIQLSIPRDLLTATDAAASERDLSRAALVALALRKLLKLM
jgi:hypothetical protein